ncbi:hypothetical protein C2845_PM08G11700 [Panicum miliaceum]|uniref:Ubiquitin-like protease family profile domain-containing protein n=1 Tax=Panicum miliaceum TaxID=4540 RepID=A0A3L6R4D2_PANMI|nr:hypothetical protein C2845_PM08G11700 [Panicum miliaceum]
MAKEVDDIYNELGISTEVINYDNVRVSYQQLAILRRSNKDYVMKHEWNQTFLNDTCGKCFTLANGCFKFTSSDYLLFPIIHEDHWFVFIVALHDGYFIFIDSFFREDDMYQQNVKSTVIPNFVRAWDEFIGIDWNFHEFVIHYAPVPKLDLKFFSKYDDRIFVMKFLELWDQRVNLIQKFSSSHIPDIRVQYMNIMVFSPHNCNNDAKDKVRNHTAMLELKRRF